MDRSNDITLAELKKDVAYIKETVNRVEARLERDYVTREEFKACEKTVDWNTKVINTVASLIILTVIGALLSLVVKK